MPSMKDSSEPVDTSITRSPRTGRSRSEWASATTVATELRLSFAPGTTARAPMSAIAAAAPTASPRPPGGAQTARRGPQRHEQRAQEHPVDDRQALVCLGVQVRQAPHREPGSSGWKTSPLWAASWWAMNTMVRAASRSPASATTFQVERCGSRRRNHSRPPLTSSHSRRRNGADEGGEQAPGRRQGRSRVQQAERPPVAAVGSLLDPRLATRRAQLVGEPLRGTPLAFEADGRSNAASSWMTRSMVSRRIGRGSVVARASGCAPTPPRCRFARAWSDGFQVAPAAAPADRGR